MSAKEVANFDMKLAILQLQESGATEQQIEEAAVDLDLASAVAQLYLAGFIAEEIDEHGVPRFRPTGLSLPGQEHWEESDVVCESTNS
jgi:hypothetical protein